MQMNDKEKAAIACRKLQEVQANLFNSGFFTEIAKWNKALYDAYIKEGFTPVEAVELVKAEINKK